MLAQIRLDYENERVAAAVTGAISPDNLKAPRNMSVKSTCHGGTVITCIESEGKLSTLIATIDDVLFSVCVAEKTVRATQRLQPESRSKQG